VSAGVEKTFEEAVAFRGDPRSAAAVSETFTVAVPFERIVRVLRDPDALTTAIVGAGAQACIDRVLVSPRGVTIMFGDIEGFTFLTERLGDRAAADVLQAQEQLVDGAVVAHDGCRVKSAGDGFMAVFADPAAALRSARRIQETLAEPTGGSDSRSGAPEGETWRMRIGVHTGAVMRVRSANGTRDVAGRNVILASRIADAADGGQVLVSSAVRHLTEPLDEFDFLAERHLRLKGLAGLHRVAELGWRSSRSPSPRA
jgi:adenylate cyclase